MKKIKLEGIKTNNLIRELNYNDIKSMFNQLNDNWSYDLKLLSIVSVTNLNKEEVIEILKTN